MGLFLLIRWLDLDQGVKVWKEALSWHMIFNCWSVLDVSITPNSAMSQRSLFSFFSHFLEPPRSSWHFSEVTMESRVLSETPNVKAGRSGERPLQGLRLELCRGACGICRVRRPTKAQNSSEVREGLKAQLEVAVINIFVLLETQHMIVFHAFVFLVLFYFTLWNHESLKAPHRGHDTPLCSRYWIIDSVNSCNWC